MKIPLPALSLLFPRESQDKALAQALACAITVMICERVPALKGINLEGDIQAHYAAHKKEMFGDEDVSADFAAETMSKIYGKWLSKNIEEGKIELSSANLELFQTKLAQFILEHIRERKRKGEGYGFNLYLNSNDKARPEGFEEIITEMERDHKFPLRALLPASHNSFSLGFVVHNDGSLFWGESGYGPIGHDAGSYKRVPRYLGQPETRYGFVDSIREMPKPDELYCFDFGAYRRCFLPVPDSKVNQSLSGYLSEFNGRRMKPEIQEQGRALVESVRSQGIDPDKISYQIAYVSERFLEKIDLEDLARLEEGVNRPDPAIAIITGLMREHHLFGEIKYGHPPVIASFPVEGIGPTDFRGLFLPLGDGRVRFVSGLFSLARLGKPAQFGWSYQGENTKLEPGDFLAVAQYMGYDKKIGFECFPQSLMGIRGANAQFIRKVSIRDGRLNFGPFIADVQDVPSFEGRSLGL